MVSVAQIMTIGCTEDEAKKVHDILTGGISPAAFPKTSAWIGQCFHRPKLTELKFSAANEVLNLFGEESFEGPNGVTVRYLNAGESYATTLMLVDGEWDVGCWTDIAEGL